MTPALQTEKINLTLPNGSAVSAAAPVLVSASRSTDIPAFYADWFFHRLREGVFRMLRTHLEPLT